MPQQPRHAPAHSPPYDLTRHAYDEVLDLLVEARNYAAFMQPQEMARRDQLTRLRASCESLRVTTRLMHVLAWLMALRAVEAGEMPAGQLSANAFRLGGGAVCREEGGADDDTLPEGLRALLRRSHALYCRIARLDAMVAGEG